MDKNTYFTWQPISSIPLFYATITVALEEASKQYKCFLLITNGLYETDPSLRKNILLFYNQQIDKILYYEEQVKKWSACKNIDENIKKTINELSNKITNLKYISKNIIELSSKINHPVTAQENSYKIKIKKIFFEFIIEKYTEEEK